MSVFRYYIYQCVKENPKSNDPAAQEELRAKFYEIKNKKPEYQKQCLELYKIKQKEGDTRSIDLMMRDCYLDFYTKSLQPDHMGGPYNKRLQVEAKEHNAILEKIMRGEAMQQYEKNPLHTTD